MFVYLNNYLFYPLHPLHPLHLPHPLLHPLHLPHPLLHPLQLPHPLPHPLVHPLVHPEPVSIILYTTNPSKITPTNNIGPVFFFFILYYTLYLK